MYATIITYFSKKLLIPKKVRTSKIPKMFNASSNYLSSQDLLVFEP